MNENIKLARPYLDLFASRPMVDDSVSLIEMCNDYLTKYAGREELQTHICKLAKFIKLKCNPDSILEIGSGLGLYSFELSKSLTPSKFYIIEPDKDLSRQMSIQLDDCVDIGFYGSKINIDYPVDLVFAGGVFVYLEMSAILEYIAESSRILKDGGKLIFNIYDSDEFGNEKLKKLIFSQYRLHRGYIYISSSFIVNFCREFNLNLVDTFEDNSAEQYFAKYLVFEKGK